MDSIDIESIDQKMFKQEYLLTRKPLLIKNAAKEWPILQKWTKEYIIENSGDYECNVISDSRPASSKSTATLKSYFEDHPGKSTLTLDKYDARKSPVFLQDIPLPNLFFKKKDIARFFFYHAVVNGGTLPHNHGDAFNILQSGTKHWVFHDANKKEAPMGYAKMMMYHKKYPQGSHAKDFFKSELSKLSKSIEGVSECYQEAGDVVYVPRQYCHTVLNKTEVMGLVIETFLPK